MLQKIIVLGILGLGFSNFGACQSCNRNQICKAAFQCPEALDYIVKGYSYREILEGSKCSSTKICCPPTLRSQANLLPSDCGKPPDGFKIAHGQQSVIGSNPWVVSLGFAGIPKGDVQVLCGGSLINSKYVLSAAHCIRHKLDLVKLFLGIWDLNKKMECSEKLKSGVQCFDHITAEPEEIIVHSEYDKKRKLNDIAIIRINININFNDPNVLARPVCITEATTRSFASNEATIAGFGKNEDNVGTTMMLEAKIKVENHTPCKNQYSNYGYKQLCAGGHPNTHGLTTDSCSGDSGGPLVIYNKGSRRHTQIGITSYGPVPCGLEGIPGVYAAVGAYRDWILENMRP